MSETVLDTRDLSMRFGGVQAVNNVNFSLRDRELRCLIGPNGAGKSTFFKCLTGQIRLDHTHGRVFIRGQDVTGWRADSHRFSSTNPPPASPAPRPTSSCRSSTRSIARQPSSWSTTTCSSCACSAAASR